MFKKVVDFDEAYKVLKDSFPVSELRSYDAVKRLEKEGIAKLYGYYEDEQLHGCMLIWKIKDIIFIENFAVNQNLRGNGTGSKMLKTISEQYKEHLIVLEVEEIFDDISKRRVAFYERNGFVLTSCKFKQPQISSEVNEHLLQLMVYDRTLDSNELNGLLDIILEVIYNPKYM